jgi:hypothetical protein
MHDVTLRNRAFGPEAVLQLVEDRSPGGFSRIEEVVSAPELEEIATSFARVAGLDVETVNGRTSHVNPDQSDFASKPSPATARMLN